MNHHNKIGGLLLVKKENAIFFILKIFLTPQDYCYFKTFLELKVKNVYLIYIFLYGNTLSTLPLIPPQDNIH